MTADREAIEQSNAHAVQEWERRWAEKAEADRQAFSPGNRIAAALEQIADTLDAIKAQGEPRAVTVHSGGIRRFDPGEILARLRQLEHSGAVPGDGGNVGPGQGRRGQVPKVDDDSRPERDPHPRLGKVELQDLVRQQVTDPLLYIADLLRVQMGAGSIHEQSRHDSSPPAGSGTGSVGEVGTAPSPVRGGAR